MLHLLPESVLHRILDFDDKNSFLFTATICKEIYPIRRSKKTSVSSMNSVTRIDEAVYNGFVLPSNIFDRVAQNDRHDLVYCLLNHGVTWDPLCVEYAGKSFLTWLDTTNLFWMPENAYASATKRNDLDLMKFMVFSRMGFPDERCKHVSLKNDFFEIYSWLTRLEKLDTFEMTSAIRKDDIEVMKMLWGSGCKLDKRMVTDACVNGSNRALWFLVSKGFTPDNRDLEFADHMYRFSIVKAFL